VVREPTKPPPRMRRGHPRPLSRWPSFPRFAPCRLITTLSAPRGPRQGGDCHDWVQLFGDRAAVPGSWWSADVRIQCWPAYGGLAWADGAIMRDGKGALTPTASHSAALTASSTSCAPSSRKLTSSWPSTATPRSPTSPPKPCATSIRTAEQPSATPRAPNSQPLGDN